MTNQLLISELQDFGTTLMEPSNPQRIMRRQGERYLWATVLLQAVRDLCANDPYNRDREDVERWIGAFPSREFKEVVSRAGLDPDAVWDRLNRLSDIPYQRRYWLGQEHIPGKQKVAA